MKQYMGSHSSTRDFPLKDGLAPKHPTSTSFDLEFNFGDVVYTVPGMVMHYLDDKESLGWENGWKPPQHFIDRVMKGGKVKFSVRGSEQYAIPEAKLGYLSLGKGDKEGKIVDTHGGDRNIDSASLTELGAVPPEFINRMGLLVTKAIEHGKKSAEVSNEKNEADTISLPPIPGYKDKIIDLPERHLSYRDQFFLLWHKAMEVDGVEPIRDRPKSRESAINYESYRVAAGLQFFTLDQDNVIARINTSSIYLNPYSGIGANRLHLDPAFNRQLQSKIRDGFAQLNIQTDEIDFPYIKISGENIERLKQLGADIITLHSPPTLEEKAAVITGEKPERIEIKLDGFLVVGGGSDVASRLYKRYSDRLYKPGEQGGASSYGGDWEIYQSKAPVGQRLAQMIDDDFARENFIAEMQGKSGSRYLSNNRKDRTAQGLRNLGPGNTTNFDNPR